MLEAEIVLKKVNLIGYNSMSKGNLYKFIEDLNPIYLNELEQLTSPKALIRDIKVNRLLRKERYDINVVIDYNQVLSLKEARDVLNSVISFTYLVKDLRRILEESLHKYTITIITRTYQDIKQPTITYKFRTPESILYMADTAYQIIDNKIFVVKQHIKNEN